MPENTQRRATRLADVLFNASHRLILKLFLQNPDASFHVRDVARRTGMSPGALHRELTSFARTGFLRRVEVGQQVHYQLDHRFPDLARISQAISGLLGGPAASGVADVPGKYRVETGTVAGDAPFERLSVGKKELASLCRRHRIRKLSFFGSVTRADFTAASDVDVLVEFQPDHSATLAHLVDLRVDLSELFGGRNVDVATNAILKNPYRRAAIEKDLQTAYVSR